MREKSEGGKGSRGLHHAVIILFRGGKETGRTGGSAQQKSLRRR
jgi:hypothetical protein